MRLGVREGGTLIWRMGKTNDRYGLRASGLLFALLKIGVLWDIRGNVRFMAGHMTEWEGGWLVWKDTTQLRLHAQIEL